MKILPRKLDIDKAKTNERKIQIDEGVALAGKIDFLRETALKEEKNLLEWRTNNIEKVKKEIEDYLTVRDNLQKQTEAAEVHRKKLLEPLDEEWRLINQEKTEFTKQKESIFISSEQLKLEQAKVGEAKKKLQDIIERIKNKEHETEKAKSEAISLKEMAQREYEIARSERAEQTSAHERKLLEADQIKKEYEVALTIIEVREREVNEKEADIIIREKHLESQQAQLKKAIEILK